MSNSPPPIRADGSAPIIAPETRAMLAAESAPWVWPLARPILAGGLAAGVLDLLFAFASAGLRGAGPERVLKFIAGGVLGPSSREGGIAVALLGLGLHFCIALGAAAAFVVANRWLPVLGRRPVTSGIIFGAAFYAFMNFVVVPLSAIPARPWAATPWTLSDLGSHMFLVGLPIALLARRLAPPTGDDRPASLAPVRPRAAAAP